MEFKFTQWKKWNERDSFNDINNPWIYILAIFNNWIPDWTVNIKDENIVYIWETCTQTLKIRLKQFNRSAFENKDLHSWGWSYSSKYNKNFDNNWNNLYISIFPVLETGFNYENDKDKDFIIGSYIRYVERKVILDFLLLHDWMKNLLNKK